ncbi:MAG: hypothetical protein ACXWB9_10270, partial [Flavisolibacter sp.]
MIDIVSTNFCNKTTPPGVGVQEQNCWFFDLWYLPVEVRSLTSEGAEQHDGRWLKNKRPDRNPASFKIQYPMKNRGENIMQLVNKQA